MRKVQQLRRAANMVEKNSLLLSDIGEYEACEVLRNSLGKIRRKIRPHLIDEIQGMRTDDILRNASLIARVERETRIYSND